MVQLSKNLLDIVKFEPLFIDVLKEEIPEFNHQHARILAMMFKLGGYTTLNVLTELINLAQPTVSLRVQELVDYRLIKKNSELMPMALVLLIDVPDIYQKLSVIKESQESATDFIKRIISKRIEIKVVLQTFIQAIKALYPDQEKLAEMIAYTYVNPNISRDQLYETIGFDDQDQKKVSKYYDEILTSNQDIFQIIYQKQKRKETFINPKLPLSDFIVFRKNYLNLTFSYYEKLLDEMRAYSSGEYEAIIPHQFLNYHSEIKLKIDACLKHYKDLRIINNSVFQQKFQKDDLITLITQSENFTKDHKLLILSKNGIEIPEGLRKDQVEITSSIQSLSKDYLSRDFLLFDTHGCLVIPSKTSSTPYYNISPRFTKSIYEIFESVWRAKDVI
jgi:predicted CopG family antitoxin